jgi:hypothetical protein
VVVNVVLAILIFSNGDTFVVLHNLGVLLTVLADHSSTGKSINVHSVLKVILNHHLVVSDGFFCQVLGANVNNSGVRQADVINDRSLMVVGP